jgi:hypothetical protein
MADLATTALRLRLPCPNCDELFHTHAFEVGTHVALSCTLCGYGWVEAVALDVSLAVRAARFCAEADPEPPAAQNPPLGPFEFPLTVPDPRPGQD